MISQVRFGSSGMIRLLVFLMTLLVVSIVTTIPRSVSAFGITVNGNKRHPAPTTILLEQRRRIRNPYHLPITAIATNNNNNNKKSSQQRSFIVLRSTTESNDQQQQEQSDSSSPKSSSKTKRPTTSAFEKIAQDKIDFPPNILDPFPQAADPTYATTASIGQNTFVVSRYGGPTQAELSNENILQIVERKSNVTDLEVNTLVWKCLGYRFHSNNDDDNDDDSGDGGGEWRPDEVFPNWKERFPNPPDLIGMQRIYSKEIDSSSLKNNQHLVRSVPDEFKQSLKTHLKPYGFTGYKVSELTPNLTRRAQCSNWLLYYREELFGYTLEELKERRRIKKQEEQEQANDATSNTQQEQQPKTSSSSQTKNDEDSNDSGNKKQYKPPVNEVF